MSSQPRLTPFDHKSAMEMADWRSRVRWPISFADSFALSSEQIQTYLLFIGGLQDEDERRVVLQSGVRCLALARMLVEVAACLQNEAACGLRLVSHAPEVDRLRGEKEAAPAAWTATTAANTLQVPPYLALRKILRTVSWSGIAGLLPALLAPKAVAVSHNDLLVSGARSQRVVFANGEALLRQGLAKAGGCRLPVPERLVQDAADALTSVALLQEPFRSRVRAEVESLLRSEFAEAATLLAGARALPDLPKALWSGTGGRPAARALGLEVLRRGGSVTRFDHGNSTPLVDVFEPTVIGELAVSSHFMLATRASAEAFAELSPQRYSAHYRPLSIGSVDSPSDLHKLPLESNRHAKRRKVIYAPTILRGLPQYHPVLLPDPVYLDWQLRLAETMVRMPVDLLCKPHPEGLLAGQEHPLMQVAPTSSVRFEEVMGEGDVFVFDYWQSSVVAEALCSNRPVVLLDLGNPLFTPKVRAMAERRCRIVKAWFDEFNRPQVDPAELEEAICGGPDHVDPGEFRQLLM